MINVTTRKNLVDLRKGDSVDGIYILGGWEKRTTSKGTFYGTGQVVDKTASIKILSWGAYNADPNYDYESMVGEVVRIKGKFESNDYGPQIMFDSIERMTDEDLKAMEFDMSNLIPSSLLNPQVAYNKLMEVAESINNPILKEFSVDTLVRFKDILMVAPAAKAMHHASLGGLVNHTLEMALSGKYIADIYNALGYNIDKDFLITAVILHDIMKPVEMDYSAVGVVKDYTFKGKAFGHIYMGARYIEDELPKYGADEELVVLLTSAVLSHHGKQEWGSPVTPITIEALILHHLDNLSAKINAASTELQQIDSKEFTSRLFVLDGTELYKK